MRKIVFRLSGLAKLGLVTAMVGVALALWVRETGPDWVRTTGGVLLLAGAALYLIERFRAWRH